MTQEKFNRIAGYEKEKTELKKLREMLHNAADYRKRGVHIPRGVILCGTPGIGKTVLARSIADKGISLLEFRAAQCSCENAPIMIQNAFMRAKKIAPCVLLLDELDKIAGSSRNYYMPGNDTIRKTLLQELETLAATDDVLVVATCNNAECLGDALLRPGRFDRILELDTPDDDERVLILKKYLKKVKIPCNADLAYLSRITMGYSGAQLECLVNEVGILALEKTVPLMEMQDFRLAMNKIIFHGAEKKELAADDQRKIATHEAGHAIVAMALVPDRFFGASIIPQGSSGGHIMLVPSEMRVHTAANMEKKAIISLAGRAAERLVYHEVFLGSEDDLAKASRTVRHLAAESGAYGFSYLLSPWRYGDCEMISDDAVKKLNDLIAERLETFDRMAEEIIVSNRAAFEQVVDLLISQKTVSKEEIQEIMKKTIAHVA